MLSLSPVHAEEKVEATVSSLLTQNEISLLDELSALDPSHNDIEGEIVSVSKIRVKQEDMETSFHSINNKVTPLGSIGTNYLTMYVTVTRLNETGYDKFQLYSYFRWDTPPFFELTDGMALSWSDNFTLINSSMTLYYKGMGFTGFNNTKAYLSGVAPEKGVGYAFPKSYSVVGSAAALPTSLQYGAIRAQIKKHNSTGTANVVSKYVHSTLTLSGPSFSYSTGPSIGVSIAGTFDHREVYTHWTY